MPLPDETTLRTAFANHDPQFDGLFYVGVKTTGIFCRPVCTARTPKPENVRFYDSAKAALYAGFRACKRCRPLDHGRSPPPAVERLMALVEARAPERLKEQDLREAGFDPSTARRQFLAYAGLTFHAYQRARRMGQALAAIKQGATMMDGQLDAGFQSASGFRAAFERLFGTPPSAAHSVVTLASQWLETPLGPMLAVADDTGLRVVDFIDRKGLETAILRLRKRLGGRNQPAIIVPQPHPIISQLALELREYFDGLRWQFSVPLAPSGSPFERSAWDYLTTIPAGEQRTYKAQALALHNPNAVRAVGRANGMNYLSIVIPCHRVVGSNGELTGYGGGLPRKQWLLDHEAKHRPPAALTLT